MDGLVKLFLIVGGVLFLGANPEALGAIVTGLFREVFGLLACLAGELQPAAAGGLVIVAVIFAFKVMLKGVTAKSSGKGKKK